MPPWSGNYIELNNSGGEKRTFFLEREGGRAMQVDLERLEEFGYFFFADGAIVHTGSDAARYSARRIGARVILISLI